MWGPWIPIGHGRRGGTGREPPMMTEVTVWEQDFRVFRGETVRVVKVTDEGAVDDQGRLWTWDGSVYRLGVKAFVLNGLESQGG